MINPLRLVPLFPVGLVIAASGPAKDPFIGDWTLNAAKSSLPDRMKVERLNGNTYTFDFGGGPETIVVNGTDQPTTLSDSGTLSVGVHGDGWNIIRKNNGHTILSALWRLSPDGNSLIDHFTAFNADGSPYTLNYVYKRTATGSGFAGTWVSTSVEAVNYKIAVQIRPFGKDGLSIMDSGPQLFGHLQFPAASIQRMDTRTREIMRGKIGKGGTRFLRLALSPDLRTLTITHYSPSTGEPSVFVFDRR